MTGFFSMLASQDNTLKMDKLSFLSKINYGSFMPHIKITTGHIVFSLLIFFIALIQTVTIVDFFAERVDENAIFLYSIGFFGGDMDPHWYGYGNLGMYLLWIVYLLLAIPPLIVGKFAFLDEYAMQVFYNGYFVLVARYVFAVIGVLAVFIYYRLARIIQVPKVLILLFAIVSIFSADAILFANYLRTDLLVGFFVALSIFFAVKSDKKSYLYLLAIATAGAISCKISALPLIIFLFVYTGYRLFDKTISWPHLLGVMITFFAFLFIFQPYAEWYARLLKIINIGASGVGHFNWGKHYHYTLIGRLEAIYDILVRYCTLPVVSSLPLLVFSRKYVKAVFPGLLMLLLLILPYINSREITYYWFAPTFNLIRFLSLIGIAGSVHQMTKLIKHKKYNFYRYFKLGFLSLIVVLVSFYIIRPSIQSYLKQYRWQKTNKTIARGWLEKNLVSKAFVALEPRYNHGIPNLYDKDNISLSKSVSRVFMYNRSKNEYLNQLFEKYLQNFYYKQSGIEKVKGLSFSKNVPLKWDRKDYYYVTSPYIYNRYLRHSAEGLNPKLKAQLENNKLYFQYMISNPLVKRFNTGRGPDIEIYHIKKSWYHNEADQHTVEGYAFNNERAEVQIRQGELLNKDLTIDMFIKLYAYPAKWTSIISKLESDKNNEFNLRLKNRETGQWYYGTGEKTIVSNWHPETVLPLNKWVRLTVIRDFANGNQKLLVNGKVHFSTFKGCPRASNTNAIVRIFGGKHRVLLGELGHLQIWNKVVKFSELTGLNALALKENKKPEGLIGYWNFNQVKDGIVKDLSGNNYNAIIKKIN